MSGLRNISTALMYSLRTAGVYSVPVPSIVMGPELLQDPPRVLARLCGRCKPGPVQRMVHWPQGVNCLMMAYGPGIGMQMFTIRQGSKNTRPAAGRCLKRFMGGIYRQNHFTKNHYHFRQMLDHSVKLSLLYLSSIAPPFNTIK